MSQGDRFRRKALRRGYKVDEVDDFLDRAEATLAGEPIGQPLTPDDIRDVVFRTRFGGYDEWQVDLHLDRLERELEDLATGAPPRQSNGFPIRDDVFPGRDDDSATAQIPRVTDRRPEPMPIAPPPAPAAPPPMPAAPPMPASAYPDSFADSLPPPMPIGYDAYAGRHGKADMTVELPTIGGGYVSPFTNEDKARVTELRGGFKVRRFGSGYDAGAVDGLFDAIQATMDGRGGPPVSDSDLDASQFPLIQGGYFEDEVETALSEVRALFSRRMG
jgi:DivIVA domain-containing protein